jgi:predicted RecA/RadA family phage recombinase
VNLNETKFQLRSEVWSSLRIPAVPSPGLEAGEMFLQGNIVCVAPETYATGEKGVGIYKADKIVLPKATGVGTDGAAGAVVYYEPSLKKLLTTPLSTSAPVGILLEAATTSADSCLVHFDGMTIAMATS